MSVAPIVSTASAVDRVPLLEAIAAGPRAWELVEANATSASPFMSWAWYRAWADAAPAGEVAASEALVARDLDGRFQAILPLQRGRKRFRRVPVASLTWAADDFGCPDHLDLLALPGAPMADLAVALETLPWDLMTLSNLAPQAEAVNRLCEALEQRGYEFRRSKLWICPYLELPGDWDGYLATLTPTRRQTVRRKERQLQREHAMTITDYEKGRVDEGLDHLLSLHARRWQMSGEVGAFDDSSVQMLHRRFAAELAARDRLWLSTLDIAGRPVAAWYGFAWGDTVHFYQSGRDPVWERESVGLVLMGTMIRRAIERGFRRFDFLRGADPYKRQWTATDRITEQVTIFRRGLGGRALRALDAVGELRARLRGNGGRWS
jgi:CelD/BcsL family acetyltransferase involved in cellulose biosynthesis